MKLKLKSAYTEETSDYPDLEEAAIDAARVAQLEAKVLGLGSATVSDLGGVVVRVVVTQARREIIELPGEALDHAAVQFAQALLK